MVEMKDTIVNLNLFIIMKINQVKHRTNIVNIVNSIDTTSMAYASKYPLWLGEERFLLLLRVYVAQPPKLLPLFIWNRCKQEFMDQRRVG